mgnify:CR=1 FL=1
MKKSVIFVLIIITALSGFSQVTMATPREETLIIDQISRYTYSNNYNLWTATVPNHIRQTLLFDTFWYPDQLTGEWINALAKEEPIYNEDYTQMTVKLREGIFWSDGIEFTADDVVFTVNYLMKNEGLRWGAEFRQNVNKVEKIDKYTVTFHLKEPNPRFHYYFTVRFDACYIMPKHYWEKVENPMSNNFYPPISLGAYKLKSADPAGYWTLYERREDWQRTSEGMVSGKAGPKYIMSIFYNTPTAKAMAMERNELDLFMDIDIDTFKDMIQRNPNIRSWYKDFPWAFPDEIDHRDIAFNLDVYPYNIKNVRWALTLSLDIVDLVTNYMEGVVRVNPMPQPATSYHMEHFHIPMLPWFESLEIEIGKNETFKPFDSSIPFQIADWAKKEGYKVPEEEEKIIEQWGIGWWKYEPEVAEKLLINEGFTKNKQGKWLLPNGEEWKISIIAPPDEIDAYTQALWAASNWRKFGIDVQIESLEREPFNVRNNTGDFEVTTQWSIGGAASSFVDKWPYIQGHHSRYYAPIGERAVAGQQSNIVRVKSKELDPIIDQLEKTPTDDENKILELSQAYLKTWVENQFSITTTSFKKFITFNETYWTNFPTAENPYGQPLYWFMGGKFVFPYIQPK